MLDAPSHRVHGSRLSGGFSQQHPGGPLATAPGSESPPGLRVSNRRGRRVLPARPDRRRHRSRRGGCSGSQENRTSRRPRVSRSGDGRPQTLGAQPPGFEGARQRPSSSGSHRSRGAKPSRQSSGSQRCQLGTTQRNSARPGCRHQHSGRQPQVSPARRSRAWPINAAPNPAEATATITRPIWLDLSRETLQPQDIPRRGFRTWARFLLRLNRQQAGLIAGVKEGYPQGYGGGGIRTHGAPYDTRWFSRPVHSSALPPLRAGAF